MALKLLLCRVMHLAIISYISQDISQISLWLLLIETLRRSSAVMSIALLGSTFIMPWYKRTTPFPTHLLWIHVNCSFSKTSNYIPETYYVPNYKMKAVLNLIVCKIWPLTLDSIGIYEISVNLFDSAYESLCKPIFLHSKLLFRWLVQSVW